MVLIWSENISKPKNIFRTYYYQFEILAEFMWSIWKQDNNLTFIIRYEQKKYCWVQSYIMTYQIFVVEKITQKILWTQIFFKNIYIFYVTYAANTVAKAIYPFNS